MILLDFRLLKMGIQQKRRKVWKRCPDMLKCLKRRNLMNSGSIASRPKRRWILLILKLGLDINLKRLDHFFILLFFKLGLHVLKFCFFGSGQKEGSMVDWKAQETWSPQNPRWSIWSWNNNRRGEALPQAYWREEEKLRSSWPTRGFWRRCSQYASSLEEARNRQGYLQTLQARPNSWICWRACST